MSNDERPEWIKCVGLNESKMTRSWCGGVYRPFFIDAEHAALNGLSNGRLIACKACVDKIIEALRNGHDLVYGKDDMSTFSSNIVPQEEDGAGWIALAPSKKELQAEAWQADIERDAARYRWLRAGNYSLKIARSLLNDTPYGIDSAVDAAMRARGNECHLEYVVLKSFHRFAGAGGGIIALGLNAWGPAWEDGLQCVAAGVPSRVDRLKAIGNGQVPLCAATAWDLLSAK